jgi:hypothetical protein
MRRRVQEVSAGAVDGKKDMTAMLPASLSGTSCRSVLGGIQFWGVKFENNTAELVIVTPT